MLILIVGINSCSISTKKNEPNDFLNYFIENEIAYLNKQEVSIDKKALVNQKLEEKTYLPNWKDELSFLNEYVNDFRKDGKLPKPNSILEGDTVVEVYKKSDGTALKLFYVNDNLVEFTINENQKSMFSTREFLLHYKSKTEYNLIDKSTSLWIMESNVEINTTFLLP
ncbi:MAG: hypothetical protein ACKVJP_01005 [Flavobacteriales bacterium]